MKSFAKLLLAAFKQFYRDRTALFFTFAFPLLFMLLFGFIFSGSDDISYEIGLVDGDNSMMSENIAQSLKAVPIFEISEGDLDGKLDGLKSGDLRAVFLIPAGLEASINSGQKVDITVYYDPSQTSSSPIILPIMNELLNEINRQLTQQPVLLELNEQSVQSQELNYIDYLVPGILAMSILFLSLFGSLPLVEWREKLILKRLGATPLRRSTVVFSQVVYRLILAVVQTIIIILVAFIVFDVQIVGNWLLLLGLVLLGALTMISISYFAVSRARTTEGAMPIIQLIQFPMLFLSGIFWPIEFFPEFMKPIVSAIPLTYLGDALRQVMVDATPLHPLGLDVAVLAAWFVVCMALAIRFFRWE